MPNIIAEASSQKGMKKASLGEIGRSLGPLSRPGLLYLIFASSLLVGPWSRSPAGVAPDGIDKLQQRLMSEAQQLIKAEAERQRSADSVVNPDFWTSLAAVQTQYDQHVVLKKLAAARNEGRLEDALALALEWERNQEITGLESDADTIRKIRATAPTFEEVAKDSYATAVKECNAGNAIENAEEIVGAARLAALIGDEWFPNWMDDLYNCAKLAPLFLEFDSNVDFDAVSVLAGRVRIHQHLSSHVQATGIKLSFDKQRSAYVAENFPLQYVKFTFDTPPSQCVKEAYGVSGTVTAIATINNGSDQAIVQILPNVKEHVTYGFGSHCAASFPGFDRNYWQGFVLTGGTGPFIQQLNSSKELSGTYKNGVASQSGSDTSIASQKSTVMLIRSRD